MRRVRAVFGCALLVLFFGSLSSAQADTVDRIAAIVDDEVITFNDMRVDGRIQLMSVGQSIDVLDRLPNRVKQLEELLKGLIQNRLLVQQATTMRAPVSEAEVDERLAAIYQRLGKTEQEYRQIMAAQGVSWTAFRRFLKNQLKASFVIRAELGGQVNVAESDVGHCAREQEPAGEEKSFVTIYQIMVQAQAEQESLGESEITRKLYPVWWNSVDRIRYRVADILYTEATADGADFSALAQQYSAGKSAERGGLLGEFSKGDLSEVFDPVFELAPGQLSDIIESSEGFHILKVESVRQGLNPDWEKAMKRCRNQLLQEETEKVISGWVDGLSAKSFVKIKLFDDISSLVEQ